VVVQASSPKVRIVDETKGWLLMDFSRLRSIAESTRGLRAWFNRAITNKKAEIDEHVAHNDGTIDMDQIRNDVFTRLNLINYLDKKMNFTDREIVCCINIRLYLQLIHVCR
jgi:hypothetical protein